MSACMIIAAIGISKIEWRSTAYSDFDTVYAFAESFFKEDFSHDLLKSLTPFEAVCTPYSSHQDAPFHIWILHSNILNLKSQAH